MSDLQITKYEKARLLGVRALQIDSGAKPMVEINGLINPLEIAEKEYREGKIPISIVRTLPNGKKIKIDIIKNKS